MTKYQLGDQVVRRRFTLVKAPRLFIAWWLAAKTANRWISATAVFLGVALVAAVVLIVFSMGGEQARSPTDPIVAIGGMTSTTDGAIRPPATTNTTATTVPVIDVTDPTSTTIASEDSSLPPDIGSPLPPLKPVLKDFVNPKVNLALGPVLGDIVTTTSFMSADGPNAPPEMTVKVKAPISVPLKLYTDSDGRTALEIKSDDRGRYAVYLPWEGVVIDGDRIRSDDGRRFGNIPDTFLTDPEVFPVQVKRFDRRYKAVYDRNVYGTFYTRGTLPNDPQALVVLNEGLAKVMSRAFFEHEACLDALYRELWKALRPAILEFLEHEGIFPLGLTLVRQSEVAQAISDSADGYAREIAGQGLKIGPPIKNGPINLTLKRIKLGNKLCAGSDLLEVSEG
ncbi:MAG TPA: hypothetical protein VGA08_02200 [Candidatus Saccharimonadales bacterium]